MPQARNVISFLPTLARILAICAGLAGVVGGFLMIMLAGFTCFDVCPSSQMYFSNLANSTMRIMTPFLGIALLALLVYLRFCATLHQTRAVLTPALALLAGGALFAICIPIGRALLPVTPYGLLDENAVVLWAQLWGIALIVFAVTWATLLMNQVRNVSGHPRPRHVFKP